MSFFAIECKFIHYYTRGKSGKAKNTRYLKKCTERVGLIFICPCIVNIIPNYNQQDATFLELLISTHALHVSGGSSAHHQEHINVHTASGIVNQYCCLLISWMRWNSMNSISSTVAASSSIG